MTARLRAALLAGLALTSPAAAQTSATIYQDGRVLVRRTVATAVPAGTASVFLTLGPLDQTSLFALDPDVAITGATMDLGLDEASAMRRAIGRPLVFDRGAAREGGRDTVVATVVGVDPERFRLADGRVVFQRPGEPRYPADLVRSAPALRVDLRSGSARRALGLGYFTGGASWSASYHLVLRGARAQVSGAAHLVSADLELEDAEVQLLAGRVGQAPPAMPRLMAGVQRAMAVAEDMAQEEVGEARLYTLPGRVTLQPGRTTTAALFEAVAAPVERQYVVRGRVSWVGPVPQTGDEGTQPVEVHYLLRRERRTDLGDRPLPEGTWRVFEPDQAGRLQLVGEAAARHAAPGQDVRLVAGTAFDLTARRTQTEYATRRDTLRTVVTAAWRVELANAKDSAVTVDVLEERQGEWRVLGSSVPAERLSATQTRFRVRIPARGETVLTYRIQASW